MTRISNSPRPVLRPTGNERPQNTPSVPERQPRTNGVSTFERTTPTTLRANNNRPVTQPTDGTRLSNVAMSGIQAAGRTSGSSTVSMQPLEMLGNLHNGHVTVEMPIDKSLINSGAVKVSDDAKAHVRFAVKDGQIDFENSKVKLDGIRALGLFKVRGAYFDRKGKLRVDMAGPDINISKAVVGDSRVPRSMNAFARALEAKHGQKNEAPANNRGASRGNNADRGRSETTTRSSESSTLDKLKGLRFEATGVALQPDKAISLGEGNAINFKPGTRLDMKGDLNNVELSGRVDLNNFALNSNGTGVELDKGRVDFRATANRSDNSINADVRLSNLNLNAPSIHHNLGNNEGLSIRDAAIANGEIRAKVSVGADGKATVPELQTSGTISAGTVEYADDGRSLRGSNLRLDLNATGGLKRSGANVGNVSLNNVNGEVSHLRLPSSDNKPFVLENGVVRNASMKRTRGADGKFEHKGAVEHFSGTLGGEVALRGSKFSGDLSAEKTTVEGSLKFENNRLDGDIGISKTDVSLNNATIPLKNGELGALNIRNANLSSDTDNAIRLEGRKVGFEGSGRLQGELNRSTLKFGNKGEITLAGGTRADLSVDAARVGRVDGNNFIEAHGSIEGRVESGRLRVGNAATLNLRGADLNLDLQKMRIGADSNVETLKGDARVDLDVSADFDRSLLSRAGIKHVEGAQGRLALDIKDAELNSDGQLSAKTAHIELNASVDEIRGRVEIPGVTRPGAVDAETTFATYTVKGGDTLSRIARNHSTSVGALSELNNISNPNLIRVGQELKIPGTERVVTPPTTPAVHTPAPTPATTETTSTATNATRSASTASTESTVALPSVGVRPALNEPLSVNPMAVAGRIQNGELEVEIPLNEKGLEDASKVLGVRTVDIDPNTRLKARLVIKEGEIQFDKSKFQFSHAPEALGFVDVAPRVTTDGKVEVEVAGLDINITKYAVGEDKIPSKVSDFMKLMTPTPEATTPTESRSSSSRSSSETTSSRTSSSRGIDVDRELSRGREFVKLGQIDFSAKGVSLAPGRLAIGDNDYIDIGSENRLDISGNSREVKIGGTVDARDAFVDMGDAEIDLGTGRIDFDATVTTGLNTSGRLTNESRVDVNFRVPEASVDHMKLTQADGQQIELRSGSIRNAELKASHSFKVGNNGEVEYMADKSSTTFNIPHFDGDVRNTRVAMNNEDGTQGFLNIAAARSNGNLSVDKDGRILANLSVDELDANVEDVDLSVPGSTLKGLDGGVSGQGRLTFDNTRGLTLDGDFTARASLEDGSLKLNGYTDLDLAKDSRANLRLTRLDTTNGTPDVIGELSIDAALDKGNVALPDGQTLSFEEGSKLSLSTALGRKEDGRELTMNGEIFAKLGRQRFHHVSNRAEVSGEVLGGMARIDLGDITLHEDGRYHIANPDISVNFDLSLLGRQN